MLRIIDANANRLTEGLRVCEDIARFALSDGPATKKIKTLRHKAASFIKRLAKDRKSLAKFRDSLNDIGKNSTQSEGNRRSIADIFRANIKRSEESLRVLEEFSKLSSATIAGGFKKMRFELYSLEKKLIERL